MNSFKNEHENILILIKLSYKTLETIEKNYNNNKIYYYNDNELKNYYLTIANEYNKLCKYNLYLYSLYIIDNEKKSWLEWLYLENN
jgi:hypothetical protein